MWYEIAYSIVMAEIEHKSEFKLTKDTHISTSWMS